MRESAAVEAAPPGVEELVQTHRGDILRWARRYASRQADVEDLAQDAVVRALRSRHSFKPGTNFPAWMRTILRNHAINGGRRARLAPRTAGDESVERAVLEAPARVEVAALSEVGDLARARESVSGPLLRAVDGISATYRRVFLLFAVEGLSYRDIAGRLGIPVGTVMSRLHRARREARMLLEGHVDARGYVAG